jgi:hypothetical protein
VVILLEAIHQAHVLVEKRCLVAAQPVG